jgi:hypothetical protein
MAEPFPLPVLLIICAVGVILVAGMLFALLFAIRVLGNLIRIERERKDADVRIIAYTPTTERRHDRKAR